MPDYRAAARERALHRGINPDIFERQIEQESGFDPEAQSPAGARGLAQFMPATAVWVAGRLGISLDAFWADPLVQLDGAAWYLGWLLDRYGGDYCWALAGYNAGPGAVDQHDGVPPYAETITYLTRILGADWPTRFQQASGAGAWRVTGTDGVGLNLREQPSTAAAVVKLLAEGTLVEVQDRAWRPVRDASNGTIGCVAEQFLVAAGAHYRVAGTDGAGLNLREEPSTAAPARKLLAEGTVVEAQDRAWRPVRDPSDGATGWVANQFITSG